MFGAEFWDERYRSHVAVWSGQPNPQLVAEMSDVAPGSALDVGSGEGADAIWMAGRGWEVTAMDFSVVALQRGAAHAELLGTDVAERIRWVQENILTWTPTERSFDLVSSQFMHQPLDSRRALFAGLAAAVAPGGTLLIVGHHPSDLESGAHRPPEPDLFYTAEEVANSLDGDDWDVQVTDSRPRVGVDHDGREITIHDAVLRARRRP